MRFLLTGAISFLIIYIIPYTTKFVESIISDFPKTIATLEISPAFIKVVLALFLWGILLFLVRRKN